MSSATLRQDHADREVQRRITTFLRTRNFACFAGLEVCVDEGRVTLQGRVPGYYEKQVALNSCRRVAGVMDLVDLVEVD